MFINRIYLLPLLFLGLLSFSAYGQKNIQLNNTLIFKVKEQYRTICFNDKINHPQFVNISTQLGTTNLKKIFPKKNKEDRPNFIDLSLIYQLTFNAQLVDVETAIQRIAASKIMEYVEPYFLPELTFTPNDTLLSQQYYLGLIDAFNAWNINQGDTSITIGITDTGWEPSHPDLTSKIKINYADPINGVDDDNDGYIDNYYGWDLGMNDNNALFESTSHGVAVTGIAAAATNNTTGIASVGFNTTFLPVKISNAAGFLTHAYQGVVYAADHGCFIINCSWGSYENSRFQEDIIKYAQINQGCLVVAAAGNDNLETPFYPASYDGVLNVAATDQSDIRKSNSNFGYHIDIAAPGEMIFTTVGNNYGSNSGTSMAAPIVAAAAAIVKNEFPTYTAQQVAAQLKATTDDISTQNPSYINKLGTGRLNLFNALNNTTAQFADITNKNITDNNNNLFENGDTLRIITELTNFLNPINGISVTLSSSSPFVNIINNVSSFPNLNMLDTSSNYTQPFTVEILSGANLNESILFQATISNGTFSYNHYFNLLINPDYIHLEENLISTTITSKGKIGFNDNNNTIGRGFIYKGKQLLYEAGFMITDGSTRVSDPIRGASGFDQDFGSIFNVAYHPPYVSALDLIGFMDDLQSPNPLQVSIKQLSYAYPTSPNDHFVIVVYEIENQSGATLNNVYAGIFSDWDILQPNVNKAGTDLSRKLGFVYALDTDSLYAGIKLLTTDNLVAHAIDVNGSGSSMNINDGFSTLEKHTALSTNNLLAGGFNGDDVAHVISANNFSIAPGGKHVVAFALLAGDSLLHLQQNADAAQTQFNNDALTVNELNNTADFAIYPNPAKEQLTIVGLPANEKNTFFITDISGKILIERTDNFTNRIAIKSLPAGIYFLNIITEKRQQVLKFVKN